MAHDGTADTRQAGGHPPVAAAAKTCFVKRSSPEW